MIHTPQHTITELAVIPPLGLHLGFADGAVFTLDLAPVIARHKALSLLAHPELFATAQVDARGGYILWEGEDIEMAADNLRHLAIEQSGGIGHERLWQWMYRLDLTQQQTAEKLGISRRMLNYYLSGAKPIPKIVWLACVGVEAEQLHQAA
jgi:hypothetical protein